MSNEPTRAAFSSPAALVMARTARRVADAYNDKALRSAAADLETRSQLYRALTRSHMLAVVINEVLQGGWLEFLGTVKLEEGASFDRVAERKRMNKDAVEALVAKRLKLIEAAGSGLETEGKPAVPVVIADCGIFDGVLPEPEPEPET